MQSIDNKRSFTLLELIIVVAISSILLFYVTAIFPTNDNKKIGLQNLKIELLDIDKNAEIMCIQEDDDHINCYICKDDGYKKFNLSLSSNIEVYHFNHDMLDLRPIKYRQNSCYYKIKKYSFSDYEIKFDYKISMDEFIVDMDNKIYLFSHVFKNINVYNSLEELQDMHQKRLQEIKDAI